MADWQFSLSSLSFAFGYGTAYDTEVDGLIDRNITVNTVPKVGDGEFLGRRRRTPKRPIFTVTINQPDAATASPIIDAFLTAWDTAPEDEHLHWKVPGITNERYVIGTPGKYALPLKTDEIDIGMAVIVAEFFVPDGLIRDAVTDAVVRY